MSRENLEEKKAPSVTLAQVNSKADLDLPKTGGRHTLQVGSPRDGMLASSSNNDLSNLLTPEERAGNRNKKRVGRVDTKPLTNHQKAELNQKESVPENQGRAVGEDAELEKPVTDAIDGITVRQKLSVSQSSHSNLQGPFQMNKRFEASHAKVGDLVGDRLVIERQTTTLARPAKHVDQYEKLKDELGDTHHIKVFVGKENENGRMSQGSSRKGFEMNDKRKEEDDPWKVEDTYQGDSMDQREEVPKVKTYRNAKERKVLEDIRKFKERNELGR